MKALLAGVLDPPPQISANRTSCGAIYPILAKRCELLLPGCEGNPCLLIGSNEPLRYGL